MQPGVRSLLYDMLKAARRIKRYTENATLAVYESDDYLQSAVERQFTVLGEALTQLNKMAPQTAKQIGDLPRIIGFRNLLVHGYAVVNHRTVWGVILNNLPGLTEQLERLLGEG